MEFLYGEKDSRVSRILREWNPESRVTNVRVRGPDREWKTTT